MRSFFYSLDKTIEDAKVKGNTELCEFCNDVRSFVLEGTFTGYKKVKTLLDYWGEPDNYVAKMTGMKEGTVRQARRSLSNELYELFGYDFFEVIFSGSETAISEGRNRLYIAKMGFSADSFLYREFINDIISKGELRNDIDISTCMLEIQFLVKYSKQSINRELEFLDVNKLVYLIRMLNNEVGLPSNIRSLIKYFEKEN